ncbi:MAG: NAD(P)-dependent dehydrogenase, short-chain alcohol dehydrogenase family, partial [Rhizorhabdus sp.]|nr:NAD(P)-dependent dehydrogenase, short-chain alcohol dehydrogenase family [Rhizorhabdus sp.]
ARRLGAAIAIRLAADCYDIAIHSNRHADPYPALLAALREHGVAWASFEADLSDETATLRLLDDVAAHFGRPPSCLVNSASMFGADGWADTGMVAMVEHYRVNAASPALLAQRLAALIGPEGRGVVINILDQAVRNPSIDHAAYTASKLALAGITQVMAHAMAPRLRVNAVAPGLNIPTDDYGAAQLDRLAAMMPLGALPTPEQVADAVAYLAGARATTGQTIFVDGGASLLSFGRDFVHLAVDES